MCIFVDYFIWYLFADAMSFAIFENTVIFFEKFVMQNFEWSRMMYFDNESHFKKDFNFKLKKQKMKHHFASISHSASIKLIKRYIKIVLNIFRVILQHHINMIFEWNRFLFVVIKTINIRMIRTFEHFSAELLLKY